MSSFYRRTKYVPVTAEQYRERAERIDAANRANKWFAVGDKVKGLITRGKVVTITHEHFVKFDHNVKGLVPGWRYSWVGYSQVPQHELRHATAEEIAAGE